MSPPLPPVGHPTELQRGVRLLHDPVHNKGTAFSESERDLLGLRGLLPPRVQTQETQLVRVLENLRRKPTDLEKCIFLVALQDRNETLFYRLMIDYLAEILPIIYTPTVGQACREYGHIFRRPRGLWISARDRGRVTRVLANWPHEDVRVVVVTDGERILGLGDLGAAGMGIPIGKLALYTACAGIPPTQCLPVTLDVGTENEALLADPLYVGLPHHRLRGPAYDELVEEFVTAVAGRFPQALIQLEDFATANAFRLLERYRDRLCLFDDDIQGTAAVALGGLLSALRLTGGRLIEQRLLFQGAGEAAVGIADLFCAACVAAGVGLQEARRHCWLFDSRGLVVSGRGGLAPHKLAYAHEHEPVSDLRAAVAALRPSVLVGVSGAPGTFTRLVLETMAAVIDRPIVFALSNPTEKSECTAREAYEWTAGRAVFASGSPFAPITANGRTLAPGQANNAYVFPGVGLGVVAAHARCVTDEMFLAAARALAERVGPSDLDVGRIFPDLAGIRDVSARIAAAVAEVAWRRGFAGASRPEEPLASLRTRMFEPTYAESA